MNRSFNQSNYCFTDFEKKKKRTCVRYKKIRYIYGSQLDEQYDLFFFFFFLSSKDKWEKATCLSSYLSHFLIDGYRYDYTNIGLSEMCSIDYRTKKRIHLFCHYIIVAVRGDNDHWTNLSCALLVCSMTRWIYTLLF